MYNFTQDDLGWYIEAEMEYHGEPFKYYSGIYFILDGLKAGKNINELMKQHVYIEEEIDWVNNACKSYFCRMRNI